MLAEETIQAVRDRVNIADVIGERVKLHRRGRSLIGLCPFHKEKSPSFNVNEDRNFYHCFGCHASGDAIKFLQETEGLSFSETIRELAQQLGIELKETRSQTEQKQAQAIRKQRDDLYAANHAAAQFFQRCLVDHPLAPIAIEELQRRGLATEEATEQEVEALTAFYVGYAPAGWDELATYLRDHGLSLRAAEAVGLVGARRSGGGFYDRFRHRLMFAVTDLRGKIIAFSGRALRELSPEERRLAGLQPAKTEDSDKPAKYINSPESPLYKKREAVFGLFQARNNVRQQDECIVVEGNFDVVSLQARGICNVVAPLGTAFTSEQAAQLRRYSSNIILLFDSDTAGRKASAEARSPCQQELLNVRVATLPDGMDPDDLVRTRGPESILRCVSGARGMLEYLIDTTLDEGFAAADPEAQGRKVREVIKLLSEEPDPTTRALARARADAIAGRVGIRDVASLQALRHAIDRALRPSNDSAPQSNSWAQAPEQARSQHRPGAMEQQILGALTEFPELALDAEAQAYLAHLSGSLALQVGQLVRATKQGVLSEQLHQLVPELRSVVARHLAAPSFGDLESASTVMLLNLRKLAAIDRKRAKAHAMEELKKAASTGDADAELELLKSLSQRLTGGL